MPEDKYDHLAVEKALAARIMRAGARIIREAKDASTAEAAMRVVGKQLQQVSGALPRLMGRDMPAGKAAPEVQPPELAEFLKRRRRRRS